ncbi:MoxR-like ATPase [Rubidibacter lacunae KORDI 51-2]|uniref:MoxR-like ATPase n=1 Tax=Rubidibacter lacunae KORDI 51-2 TaxID=582515 RepID=U5DPU3_9CHRO|nr:MoxR family ATPase [Rubidibacter lacunae]ERN41720.1 MoxR-like ATPase [Rubidibacter lacunae KORDI 51-2]
MKNTLDFKGIQKRQTNTPHSDSPQHPEPYIASKLLVDAVNLAIFLQRPLLLEGEAGCGKTRLAIALAYELGLPLYRWNIRSTTKYQEGLYEYDAVLRLHDVHARQAGELPRDPAYADNYIEYGPLGKAFTVTDRPAVVLIDEIDKAELDFPNDLLAVLDEPWEFRIRETGGDPIRAHHVPIVIITSNKEKGNLPAPFLRRCLYHFIKFPDTEEALQEIVEVHYLIREEKPPSPDLAKSAISRFLQLREREGLYKKPGTSEFLDWLRALASFRGEPFPTEGLQDGGSVPYPELLFKLRADWRNFAIAL